MAFNYNCDEMRPRMNIQTHRFENRVGERPNFDQRGPPIRPMPPLAPAQYSQTPPNQQTPNRMPMSNQQPTSFPNNFRQPIPPPMHNQQYQHFDKGNHEFMGYDYEKHPNPPQYNVNMPPGPSPPATVGLETQMKSQFQNSYQNSFFPPVPEHQNPSSFSNFRPNLRPSPNAPPSFPPPFVNNGTQPHHSYSSAPQPNIINNAPPALQPMPPSMQPLPMYPDQGQSYTPYPPGEREMIPHQMHVTRSHHSTDYDQTFQQNQQEKAKITDEAWLVDWLDKIKKQAPAEEKEKSKEESKDNSLMISEAQKQMRSLLVTMATLKQQTSVLEECAAYSSPTEWATEFSKTESLKKELIAVQTVFNSPETIRDLKTNIDNRRKKRERLRKRKQEQFQQKQTELVQREILHAKVDKWREGVTQKMLDAKQKKEMKKMADKTLGEVRSKISETSKKLELLNGLQRLRKIRMESAVRIGRYTPNESDSTFESQMSQLYNILTNQREVYEGEEKTLKVILEAEQEETQGLEKQRKKQIKEQREKRMEKRKNEMLFGKEVDLEETDPLYPFHQYYKQADYDFQSFLEIRHSWDFWLTADNVGSSIPVEWVLPPLPSNDGWAKYLT